MIIKLSPVRRDETLSVIKNGNTLEVNGELFDFSQMVDGDTLPVEAITSSWFSGQVDNVSGDLTLTMILPNPWNFSPEQAFPVDLIDVPDGPVQFPMPLPEPLPPLPEPVPDALHELALTKNIGEMFVVPVTKVDGELEA